MKKSIDLIGNRTRDLAACGIVPEPTTQQRAPIFWRCLNEIAVFVPAVMTDLSWISPDPVSKRCEIILK
jgi:hypothetical protein